METQQPLYPIREVSRLTGVNSITLRAWERRYGLIEPIRTESGHRLYTQDHIELINRAVVLTQKGVQISQVKSLLDQAPDVFEPTVLVESNHEMIDSLYTACVKQDLAALNQSYDLVFSDFPEKSAYKVLNRVSQKCQETFVEHPAEKLLFEACTLPRLMTRARHLCLSQRTKAVSKCLVQGTQANASSVNVCLAGLWCSSKGYLSINPNSFIAAVDLTRELIKSMGLETVCIVAEACSGQEWIEWAKQHSTIELILIHDDCEQFSGDIPVNVQLVIQQTMWD